MSKADIAHFEGLSIVSQGYTLGNEGPRLDVYGEPHADPLRTDCSGYLMALWQAAGALFSGKSYSGYFGTIRPTADVMFDKSVRISAPSQFGDLFFLLTTPTHAHHVGMYIGGGRTIEAGYHGSTLITDNGVVRSVRGSGHVGIDTVAWQNARGAVWGRLPHDMGELTPRGGRPEVPNWPVMAYGFSGVYARQLKRLLNMVLGTNLTISYTDTGNAIREVSERAIKQMQVRAGLYVTGIADRDLLIAIAKELAPEGEEDVTDEQYKDLRNIVSQLNYDLLALGRAIVKDYAQAAQLNADRYSRWPGERGVFPQGLSAEELKALVEG